MAKHMYCCYRVLLLMYVTPYFSTELFVLFTSNCPYYTLSKSFIILCQCLDCKCHTHVHKNGWMSYLSEEIPKSFNENHFLHMLKWLSPEMYYFMSWLDTDINTLSSRQKGRHFTDDILKCIFLNENIWNPINISLKFVPKGPINNAPALIQIMAWRRPGLVYRRIYAVVPVGTKHYHPVDAVDTKGCCCNTCFGRFHRLVYPQHRISKGVADYLSEVSQSSKAEWWIYFVLWLVLWEFWPWPWKSNQIQYKGVLLPP